MFSFFGCFSGWQRVVNAFQFPVIWAPDSLRLLIVYILSILLLEALECLCSKYPIA